jgi:hypothetical protein
VEKKKIPGPQNSRIQTKNQKKLHVRRGFNCSLTPFLSNGRISTTWFSSFLGLFLISFSFLTLFMDSGTTSIETTETLEKLENAVNTQEDSKISGTKRPATETQVIGQTKKSKTTEAKPSKIILIKNLPSDASEPELVSLASPFGRVSSILMMKGKGQAFVQMEDEISSTALVEHYSSEQPSIRYISIFHLFKVTFSYSIKGFFCDH